MVEIIPVYELLLERIAVALERQVAQVDEQMARNQIMRAENIDRHNRERDEELAEARAVNDRLMVQIDALAQINAANLAHWQALGESPSTNAVDPIGRSDSGPTPRDEAS